MTTLNTQKTTRPYLRLDGLYRNGPRECDVSEREWTEHSRSQRGSTSIIPGNIDKAMAYARELAFSGRRYQGLDFKVRLVRVMAKTEQVLYEYQELTRYEVTFGKEIEGTKVTLDTLPLFDFPEKATDAAAKLSSLGYWTTVKQLPKNASFLRPPFGGDALVEVKET